MNDSVKPRIDFDSAPQPELSPQTAIRGAQDFSSADEAFVAATPGDDEQLAASGDIALEAALRPKRSLWRKMIGVGVALFGVSVLAQSVQWGWDAWQTRDWIALGGGAASALVVVAAGGSLLAEWRRLYRLRERATERDRARELLASEGVGEARAFCEKLANQAGLTSEHPALLRFQAALHETQNDREVITLFVRLVQPVLDSQARQEISRSAAESALMIAISPLALVDMALIAWRNLRLVNRIAALYGIELGYFSRIRLLRLVLLNMAFAGATDLIRDMGADWMSQDLAARLSARAAQGIGAGLLTARLGVKTMELCRPLPWLEGDKPRLGDFRRDLIAQLKTQLKPRDKRDV